MTKADIFMYLEELYDYEIMSVCLNKRMRHSWLERYQRLIFILVIPGSLPCTSLSRPRCCPILDVLSGLFTLVDDVALLLRRGGGVVYRNSN